MLDLKNMLEIIVSLIAIVSAVFGLYMWILPRWRNYQAQREKSVMKIRISISGRSIDEKDKFLKQILLKQKRDTFLDRPFSISLHDQELDKLKNKLKDLSHQDQASQASYISSSEDKIKNINSMLSILFEKKVLKMIDAIGLSSNELVLIVRGALQLFDVNVTGRKKLGIWRDSDPKLSFGIFITPEETEMIEKKINKSVNTLMGSGCLYATELPAKIIARHVIPGILFQIALYKEKFIEHRETLFMLFKYHVGLG